MEKSTVDHQREDKHSNSTRSAHGRNLAHNSFMSLKLKYFGHIKRSSDLERSVGNPDRRNRCRPAKGYTPGIIDILERKCFILGNRS